MTTKLLLFNQCIVIKAKTIKYYGNLFFKFTYGDKFNSTFLNVYKV